MTEEEQKLLDYFAGQALAGLLSRLQDTEEGNYTRYEEEGAVKRSWDLAKDMLSERQRRLKDYET